MDRVYIFDVDGTLTPSRQPITEDFEEFFYKWSMGKKYYLVTGSDLDKLKEQIGLIYLDRAESIFTCCGNQQWKNNELLYDNKFNVPKKLKKLLGTVLSNSKYPIKAGNHIEDRGTMVNFSIVGRNCTQEQREEYYKWDKDNNERKMITNAIKEKFPDLDAVIGGQISIDIYPKGKDKSQILEHIVDADEYVFFGDKTEEGGNDYPLAKLLRYKDVPYGYVYQVDGWEHTKKMLENVYND